MRNKRRSKRYSPHLSLSLLFRGEARVEVMKSTSCSTMLTRETSEKIVHGKMVSQTWPNRHRNVRTYVRLFQRGKSCRNFVANPVGLVSHRTGICVAQRVAGIAMPYSPTRTPIIYLLFYIYKMQYQSRMIRNLLALCIIHDHKRVPGYSARSARWSVLCERRDWGGGGR